MGRVVALDMCDGLPPCSVCRPPQTLQSQHESSVLARVAAGDGEAFSELIRPYLPFLLAYATRLLRSEQDADDIVQNVLCRAWDNRWALARCDSVRAYLTRAVRNAAFDSLKQEYARRRWTDAYAHDVGIRLENDSPETGSDIATAVQAAIQALPERRREILELRLQQFTYPEIASVLNISSKTVEAQVTLAFRTLRDRLKSWMS